MTTNPLHLYRWLLRECTYLPDPKIRAYVKGQVISGFRKHQPERLFKAKRFYAPKVPLLKQADLLKRGRQSLSILSRANQGYLTPLTKLLRLTYGRSGRLRRERMSKLSVRENGESAQIRAISNTPLQGNVSTKSALEIDESSQPPTNEITPSNSSTKDKHRTPPQDSDLLLPPKLAPLLISQAKHQHFLPEQKTKLRVKPRLQETTIWNRPTGTKSISKQTAKWYAKTLGGLYPPLSSEAEFDEVRDLVVGVKEWPTTNRTRRPRAEPVTAETTDSRVSSSSATAETTTPQPNGQNLSRILIDGADNTGSFSRYVAGRPHRITPRLMRRLLGRVVLTHTPRARVVGHNATTTSNSNSIREAIRDGIRVVDKRPTQDVPVRIEHDPKPESVRKPLRVQAMRLGKSHREGIADREKELDTVVRALEKDVETWSESTSTSTSTPASIRHPSGDKPRVNARLDLDTAPSEGKVMPVVYTWEEGRKSQYSVKHPTEQQRRMLFG